jgi:hypothetical protein
MTTLDTPVKKRRKKRPRITLFNTSRSINLHSRKWAPKVNINPTITKNCITAPPSTKQYQAIACRENKDTAIIKMRA